MKAQWKARSSDPGRQRPQGAVWRRPPGGRASRAAADLQRAADCVTARSPSWNGRSPSTNRAKQRRRREPVFLEEEVEADDVAEVVARCTGIPVSRLLEGEVEKLIHMEERLHERVVGQDEAIEALARPAPLARRPAGPTARSARFCSSARPASARPSWRGAAVHVDSQDAMIRIDMSEYMEKHTVSRLLGAPPGYVGYEEAASSPRRCAATPTAWCCWTRSRRRTPTCSTRCCR